MGNKSTYVRTCEYEVVRSLELQLLSLFFFNIFISISHAYINIVCMNNKNNLVAHTLIRAYYPLLTTLDPDVCCVGDEGG